MSTFLASPQTPAEELADVRFDEACEERERKLSSSFPAFQRFLSDYENDLAGEEMERVLWRAYISRWPSGWAWARKVDEVVKIAVELERRKA